MNSCETGQHSENETPKSVVRLVLNHYVPASRNQLKGAHWSAEFHEKKRAALALRSALRCLVYAHVIGTDTILSPSSTWLSTLESYQVTHGISLTGVSVREKFQRRKKKKL